MIKGLRIRRELQLFNHSAVNSLDEGIGKTLRLNLMGFFLEFGISSKATNCTESLMALIGQKLNRIDYWRNSDQKHGWFGAVLLDIEPRFRKVKGMDILLS